MGLSCAVYIVSITLLWNDLLVCIPVIWKFVYTWKWVGGLVMSDTKAPVCGNNLQIVLIYTCCPDVLSMCDDVESDAWLDPPISVITEVPGSADVTINCCNIINLPA